MTEEQFKKLNKNDKIVYNKSTNNTLTFGKIYNVECILSNIKCIEIIGDLKKPYLSEYRKFHYIKRL